MPIYEYKCSSCDSHFEKLQKASDEALKVCEECGGELQKQWSLSGFQFKGEGWYVTDYAGKNGKAPEKKASSESTVSSESASKKKPSESSSSSESPKKSKETKKKD